ncbi:hypothetical protein MKZ20_21585 [Psychrobacillus sp. FSL K6-2684]|uniref:hypothetical protein n=1 Tax=unclassified Psychrobacillus TaxID=2636677 RepID=UPI0030F84997
MIKGNIKTKDCVGCGRVFQFNTENEFSSMYCTPSCKETHSLFNYQNIYTEVNKSGHEHSLSNG